MSYFCIYQDRDCLEAYESAEHGVLLHLLCQPFCNLFSHSHCRQQFSLEPPVVFAELHKSVGREGLEYSQQVLADYGVGSLYRATWSEICYQVAQRLLALRFAPDPTLEFVTVNGEVLNDAFTTVVRQR